MAMFDNERDSKQALLNDLKSLHSMLEEDAKTTIQKDTPARSGPGDLTKIPLLQDIFDPEHPEQEIQIEQLNVDHVERWVTGNLFDETVDPVTGQTADQPDRLSSEPVEADAGYEPDESIDYAPQDLSEENSTELTALYAEYANQWGEPEIPEISTAGSSFTGLSAAEADEFLELLIEEHADEILDLLKDILKDRLSLLVTQVRDNDSASGFTDSDDLAGDFPSENFSDDQS